ncbi:hypothetical protein ACKW6Q_11165 [Chryseobacterium kwangjuense]|uniref:Uncharacterized protein n=1 Tax=Chryseobacterium kwangjuense TaxID=267125 RepID=A0ABW9K497_9FLAO
MLKSQEASWKNFHLGGTNNGGTTGNIVCREETKRCSQEQMIKNPNCCVCVESFD